MDEGYGFGTLQYSCKKSKWFEFDTIPDINDNSEESKENTKKQEKKYNKNIIASKNS